MVRTTMSLSANRSLVVLFVFVLLTLAGIGAAHQLGSSSPEPLTPFVLPAENPAPVAPLEASPAPMPASDNVPPGAQTVASPLPAAQTAPVPPARGISAPTTAPHPTIPAGPATTANPGHDLPVIAPEPGMPSFSPPPPHE